MTTDLLNQSTELRNEVEELFSSFSNLHPNLLLSKKSDADFFTWMLTKDWKGFDPSITPQENAEALFSYKRISVKLRYNQLYIIVNGQDATLLEVGRHGYAIEMIKSLFSKLVEN